VVSASGGILIIRPWIGHESFNYVGEECAIGRGQWEALQGAMFNEASVELVQLNRSAFIFRMSVLTLTTDTGNSPPLPVVILAGGLATRLRPLTEKIPKALIEVASRPFLEHQIELLKRNGLTEIILCVSYLGEMIREKYSDGSGLGVHIRYSFDGPQLLGTGGAIKRASSLLPEAFFVLYGDSYLPVDYQAVAKAFTGSGQPALMTVYGNSDAWDTSNVWFDDGKIRLYSKRDKLPEMRYIDYGLMVCTKRIFEDAPNDVHFDLAGTLEELSRKGFLAGYEVKQRFYEIGSPAGLAELQRLLSDRSELRGK
jgi:N-acetyl-alpha-D-muramate 1-phosphate uridylyltransferase